MALMVAYYLTFVLMLTFSDHSRIWYVGFFFINKPVLVMQKGLAMTYLRVDRHKIYIFWQCKNVWPTILQYQNMPKVDIHLRFCVAVIFLRNMGYIK